MAGNHGAVIPLGPGTKAAVPILQVRRWGGPFAGFRPARSSPLDFAAWRYACAKPTSTPPFSRISPTGTPDSYNGGLCGMIWSKQFYNYEVELG